MKLSFSFSLGSHGSSLLVFDLRSPSALYLFNLIGTGAALAQKDPFSAFAQLHRAVANVLYHPICEGVAFASLPAVRDPIHRLTLRAALEPLENLRPDFESLNLLALGRVSVVDEEGTPCLTAISHPLIKRALASAIQPEEGDDVETSATEAIFTIFSLIKAAQEERERKGNLN